MVLFSRHTWILASSVLVADTGEMHHNRRMRGSRMILYDGSDSDRVYIRLRLTQSVTHDNMCCTCIAKKLLSRIQDALRNIQNFTLNNFNKPTTAKCVACGEICLRSMRQLQFTQGKNIRRIPTCARLAGSPVFYTYSTAAAVAHR